MQNKNKKQIKCCFDIISEVQDLKGDKPIQISPHISPSKQSSKKTNEKHIQNCNNVEIQQLLKDPDKDIKIFEVYYENTNEYLKDVNTKIKQLIKNKQYHLAEQIYHDFLKNKFQLNIHLSISILQLYIKWEKFDKCLNLLPSLIPQTSHGNPYLYSVLLNLYAKTKQPQKCQDIISEMKLNNIQPDQYHYASFIESFTITEQFEKGFAVYSELVKKKIRPNKVLYNQLIDLFQSWGQMEQAMIFYENMKKDNIFPDQITYSLIIKGFMKQGQFIQAQQMLLKVGEEGLKYNGYIFSAILDGYAKVGQIQKVLEVWDTIPFLGAIKDSVCYGSMIEIFSKIEWDRTHQIYKEAKTRRVRISPITYNILIQCCEFFNQYEEGVHIIKEAIYKKYDTDVIFYSHVIRFYLKNNRYSKAIKLFQEMEFKKIAKNSIIYGHFFLYFHNFKLFKNILDLYQEMVKEFIYFEEIWYKNIYMDALKYEGFYQEAIDYFFSIDSKIYDEVSFCIIYDTLCWKESPQDLLNYHNILQQYNKKFSENTYNSIIQAFFRIKQFDQGMEIFFEMVSRFPILQNPIKTYVTMHKPLVISNQIEHLDKTKSYFAQNYPIVDLNLFEIRNSIQKSFQQ